MIAEKVRMTMTIAAPLRRICRGPARSQVHRQAILGGCVLGIHGESTSNTKIEVWQADADGYVLD